MIRAVNDLRDAVFYVREKAMMIYKSERVRERSGLFICCRRAI